MANYRSNSFSSAPSFKCMLGLCVNRHHQQDEIISKNFMQKKDIRMDIRPVRKRDQAPNIPVYQMHMQNMQGKKSSRPKIEAWQNVVNNNNILGMFSAQHVETLTHDTVKDQLMRNLCKRCEKVLLFLIWSPKSFLLMFPVVRITVNVHCFILK